ncbi:helix-turn-helix transcriptional regulator [Chryseobacterium fluminis]|uniref:helix-turn-helix domain-containing protein n=1 Tax=Chryseobacterium fluminis TaxID=2983606 RepID=UPI00224CA2D5|nr:helix-turn-helix transcriptional regulator [Chryseobacterium sp. MMS21-Ot14]UZT96616.1 helix-turn-helix transcriptional regulator [Chryseobacterium sp. MMS21-Ot14]
MGVGTNLKRLRSKTKFSQQDIADKLNIDRVTYANWESEMFDVKSQYIPKLAEIFEVELKELFEDGIKNINTTDNTFENKDDSTSGNIIVFNLSDKDVAEKLSSQFAELIKNIKK